MRSQRRPHQARAGAVRTRSPLTNSASTASSPPAVAATKAASTGGADQRPEARPEEQHDAGPHQERDGDRRGEPVHHPPRRRAAVPEPPEHGCGRRRATGQGEPVSRAADRAEQRDGHDDGVRPPEREQHHADDDAGRPPHRLPTGGQRAGLQRLISHRRILLRPTNRGSAAEHRGRCAALSWWATVCRTGPHPAPAPPEEGLMVFQHPHGIGHQGLGPLVHRGAWPTALRVVNPRVPARWAVV